MGVAVVSSRQYGPAVEGPWDAVESIAQDFLDDVFQKIVAEVAQFANEHVDMIFADEYAA
eukprot:jgi/Hompol1/1704/HPOL_005688-RA